MEPEINLRSAPSSIGRLALALCALLPIQAASGQWRATGPFGGDAELVRIVPKLRNMVVAGTHNGLIFVSTNGGAYWNPVHFPAQFAGTLHALEVDPQDPALWYAGVESETPWLAGIWKTTDTGRTWNLIPDTKGLAVWSLAIFPGDSKVVVAGTGVGIFRTDDRGTSWKRMSPVANTELKPVVSLAFHPANSSTLYAGTTHLPWRTADGGATWQSIHEGMLDDSDVFSIVVDPTKPARVFASACSGVYASQDEAARWTKLSTPPGAFRTYFVAMEPKRPEIVFAGTTEGLLRSPDGGHSWRKVSQNAVRSMAFDPWVTGRLFFASSTAGLLVSTDDGMTLRESNFGFTNRNFTTLTGAGGQLYSSSVYEPVSGGVYSTGNLGLRWTRSGEPRTNPSGPDQLLTMSASPDNPEQLLAAGYRGMLKSSDGGRNWAPAPSPPGGRIMGLAMLPGGVVLAATEQGIFRGTNDGMWSQAASLQAATLTISAGMPVALTGTTAYVSKDHGATWSSCGNPQDGATWYGLAFDPGAGKTAIAATSAGAFRSADGCESWSAIRSGLRAETTSLALFHPIRRGEAYVSQGGRVFQSLDGGMRWAPLDDDANATDSLVAGGPSSLFVLPSAPDRLFALFPRRGVFSTTIVINKETTLQ